MAEKSRDLGAQDPELRNSPVAWETDEETDTLRETVSGKAVCYFNGDAYSNGTLIRSGATVLRCDEGVWVPEGAGD